jgi:hypothetical protein
MRRISSRWTAWHKWRPLLPLLFLPVACAATYSAGFPVIWAVTVFGTYAAVSAAFLPLNWGLADEVEQAGDVLRVRRGTVEARVALADVHEVRPAGWLQRGQLLLELRKPGVLGRHIVFVPQAGHWFDMGRNAVLADLQKRVGATSRARPPSR